MSDINIGLLAENQTLSEFEITENFSCVRFLDQNKERFELLYFGLRILHKKNFR